MAAIDSIISFDYWILLGGLYQIFLLFYVIFALIIVRQIHLMTSTLNGSLDPYIKTFGFIHMLFAFAVFFFGWIVLL